MNMMVSTALVGASAVPIASPSVAAASRSGVPAGGLERLQSAINLLRSSYVCDGWKVDEAGAEQALQYFRDGCPDDDDAWGATIEFFNSHGLSYDWIICGDVGSLVCLAAKHSTRAAKGADAELLNLANDYIEAEQRYCDLNHQVDVMSDERGPTPEALRILPSDADLGRTPWQETDEFWHRPCDIKQWRELDKWVSLKNVNTDDRMEMVMERKPPSPELRARAEQIVIAYDQWQAAGKRPAGYRGAVQALEEAEAQYREIEETITETRAATVEGLFAKVRCAQAYMKTEGVIDGIDQGGAAETMALSIFEDLQELTRADA